MSEEASNNYDIKEQQDCNNIQPATLEEEPAEKYEVTMVGDIRVRFSHPYQ
ncbi:MAG: hypothetical protein RCO49_06870 [Rickettsia endosymbiont of Argas persicus]